jgi:hypothetical protein
MTLEAAAALRISASAWSDAHHAVGRAEDDTAVVEQGVGVALIQMGTLDPERHLHAHFAAGEVEPAKRDGAGERRRADSQFLQGITAPFGS